MYDFMFINFDYPSEHDIRKFVLSVQRKYKKNVNVIGVKAGIDRYLGDDENEL